MKRIMLATHDYSYTGAPLVLFQLAKYLPKSEYQVTISHGQTESIPGPLEQDYETLGISGKWLGKPDVVIANTLLSWPTVKWAKDHNVPCIWWLHEGEWATKVLWHHDMQQLLWHQNKLKALVVGTEYMHKLYAYNLDGIRLIKYATPYTSLDNDDDDDDRMKSFIFCVAGSIEHRKGQLMAVRAFKSLPFDIQHKSALYLIGNGWGSQYGQQVQKESRGERIKLADGVDPQKFRKLLSKIDCLLCPSTDEGGFPQVLLQAQEAGKKVVAHKVCGMQEQIPDGTGYLILPSENEELSLIRWGDMMAGLVESNSPGTIWLKARDWAHTNNSLNTHIQEWDKLIKEVLK